MSRSSHPPSTLRKSSKTALVLAGGAARGAYEAGVIAYILKEVSTELNRVVPIHILCGTSIGAINACMLAAHADDPIGRADRLLATWKSLRVEELVRADTRELLSLVKGLISRHKPSTEDRKRARGGLLDSSGIGKLVDHSIPFHRIDEHIHRGKIHALTVSTTHVASGKTVIFIQKHHSLLPRLSKDMTIVARAAEIRREHALASSAIPLLFPAVRIQNEFYCDGGLRQNVPLSPARRLGADGMVVINPRFVAPPSENINLYPTDTYPGPLFILGKALNALLLDRIDNDIDRLQKMNAILEAGRKHYGDSFVENVNIELGNHSANNKFRPLSVVHIRASRDIGELSAAYARSAQFAARASGVIGKVIQSLAEWQGAGESDLLSYLLFDGQYAAQLAELGFHDARLRHHDLCQFFEPYIRLEDDKQTLKPISRPSIDPASSRRPKK